MTARFPIAGALLMTVTLVHAQPAVDGPELLASIRAGDQKRAAALLRRGANPNARDEAGATALMHAAAFGAPGMVRTLLDAGAGPRLSDRVGSTALMWGTHDAGTVRSSSRPARTSATSARMG